MRRHLARLLACNALLAAGCAPSIQGRVVPLAPVPPGPESERIDLYREAPPGRTYEVLARLDVHAEAGFEEPAFEKVVSELDSRARLAGAQAVVVVEERRWRIGENRILHVTAAAIRYTAAPAPPPAEASVPPSTAATTGPVGARAQDGLGPRFPAGPAPAWPELHPRLLWLVRLGFDFGFTPLISARTTSGSTETLYLNEGLRLDVGAIIPNTANGLLETQVSVGGKVWDISGSNGSATSYSFPLEALECLSLGLFRAGAGVSVLLWPTVQGTGLLSPATTHFDTAVGPVAEVAFQMRLAPFGRQGVEPLGAMFA